MKKRKLTIALVVAILLTAGGLWAFMRSGPDPQLETVKQMQAEMFKPGTRPDPAKLAELREAEKQLTPAQKQQLGQARRERFEQRINQTMDTYFSLPKEKKTAYLDERIKEEDKWRQARDANRGQGGGSGGPGGGSGGGTGGPGGTGGTGGMGGAGEQGQQGPNNDARDQRQLQRMDSMSATRRAQFQTFRADMNQRRMDLGLPPMSRRPLPPR
jgi:uncharacterized membrane protein YgcG